MADRCEWLALGLLMVVACVGCGLWGGEALPDTLPELQTLAVQERDAAQAARASRSPEVADTAAVRAEAAAEKAATLVAGTPEPVEADRLAAQETALAARDARRFARLADEDRRLAELLDGWRATAYRTARDLAFPGACQGLALAADQADCATMGSLQALPNNPVAVFLTGERLAASGEPEQAADSLEAAARGTRAEWLAERIARRARELRDDPHASGTLVHDGAFLRDVVLFALSEAAQKSDVARVWHESLAAARSLAQRILDRIPGVGTGDEPANDAT